MSDTVTVPPPTPANENNDPLQRADTALDELYRVRGQLLSCDLSRLTFEQRRGRRNALYKLDKAIRLCLSYL